MAFIRRTRYICLDNHNKTNLCICPQTEGPKHTLARLGHQQLLHEGLF